MADYDELTYHRIIGRYNGIVADSTGPFGDPGTTPDLYTVNMAVSITLGIARGGKIIDTPPELRLTGANPPRTLLLLPYRASVESGALRLPGAAMDGVDVVAKSAVLGLGDDDDLVATVTFGDVTIGGASYRFDPVSYVVPTVEPEDYHAGAEQVIALTGTPTGGTWALVYGPFPTVTMPPTATGATVQNALRGLAAIGDNVTVDGPAGGPWTATFNTAAIPRPYPLGKIDNLTGTGLPGVSITDLYTPPIIDLTTVTRWAPTAA